MLEDSENIELGLRRRLEVERLFAKYFTKRGLKATGQFISAMKKFPVLFIYEFVNLLTVVY